MRLGFIGVFIATSISFDLIPIASIIYGVPLCEKNRLASESISMRPLTLLDLGLLARLSVVPSVRSYRCDIPREY